MRVYARVRPEANRMRSLLPPEGNYKRRILQSEHCSIISRNQRLIAVRCGEARCNQCALIKHRTVVTLYIAICNTLNSRQFLAIYFCEEENRIDVNNFLFFR